MLGPLEMNIDFTFLEGGSPKMITVSHFVITIDFIRGEASEKRIICEQPLIELDVFGHRMFTCGSKS